ncbi:PP2C family protein-serine/threonine phosphatase [Actinokineospora sp. UTMC 2448]|uniref:PP2C family protein-serine/threonine phosphatase n=1 Tax=Actinokineospora sp. UTMC 2448 TaxID=2268449 RepID=UPI0021648524|nr:GAF domain-containing SpoIIE family protein phosphatase [Actinokineospora sp. UTMC 2448]UVS79685.1 Formate hydrogenlyase transcriptional activator [Actinokineospora sp. UTMC 2448]
MAENPSSEEHLLLLEAISDAALGHMDLDKLLRTILERVRTLLSVDTATVLLLDHEGDRLTATAAAGLEEEVVQGVIVPVGSGFAGRVAAMRKPVVLPRVDQTTVVNPLLWERGLHVLLGVPMLARDELVGVLHIGSVAHRGFTAADVRLLQIVADRLALAVRMDRLAAERGAAEALQRSLLPSRLPAIGGLEFASRYVPDSHTGVGGDWYDVFPLPGGRLGIVIGDVTGRGLGAAVIMGRLRSALRAYALDHDDPAEVLRRLDHKVCHFETGAMATVSYAVVDESQRHLTVSLAGHLPPVLAVPGEAGRLLDLPVDLPIGPAETGAARRATRVDLPPGAVVAFYTDGLVERRDAIIDEGLGRLAAAITADPAERVCARVMATMLGANPAGDDVALLVARRSPSIVD